MQSNHAITARIAQLATALEMFDPWYELDHDRDMDELEREFAELRMQLSA